MAGMVGTTPYYILSEFFAQLLQFLYGKGLEVGGRIDMLEYGRQDGLSENGLVSVRAD